MFEAGFYDDTKNLETRMKFQVKMNESRRQRGQGPSSHAAAEPVGFRWEGRSAAARRRAREVTTSGYFVRKYQPK